MSNDQDITPLPWKVFTNPDGTKVVGVGGLDGEGILDAGFGVWAWKDPDGIANADFIVKACNSYPAMKAALETARNYVDAVVMNTPDKKKRRNYAECLRIIDAALG